MSFSNQLLFDDIRSAFNDGDITEGALANHHPLMEGVVDRLAAFAELIGVNFRETGSTFRLGKSGFINCPELKAFNGVPGIGWGEVHKPLTEILEIDNISCTFSHKEKAQKEKGNNFYLLIESDELGEDQQPLYSYLFPVACDAMTPRNLITKAFDGLKNGKTPEIRQENLQKFTGYLLQRAKSMGNLPVGTYTVVGFGSPNQYGYTITLSTGEKVFTNSKLTGILRDLTVDSISESKPAVLTVTGHGTYKNESTGKVSPTCKFEFMTADSLSRRAAAKAYRAGKVSTIDQTEFDYPEAEDHSVATLEPVEDVSNLDDIAF